jgi:hypothetical protein
MVRLQRLPEALDLADDGKRQEGCIGRGARGQRVPPAKPRLWDTTTLEDPSC